MATTTERTATPTKVVNEYLDALSAGDFDTVATLVADEFSFRGPLAQAHGREQFIASASRMGPIVRGHDLLRQWEDNGEVCSIYDFHVETPAGAGSVVMSEWCTVRAGRLTSSRLIYDAEAWRALTQAT